MMNRKTYLERLQPVALACVLMLLPACSHDEEQPADGMQPVTFSATLGKLITRSTLDNAWDDGTQIYICCTEDGQTDKKYVYQYAASTGAWTATNYTSTVTVTGKYYWPISDPSWTFSAWPQSYGENPRTTMTVEANQSVYSSTNTGGITDAVYQGYDLLYAPPVAATYRQPVTLSFLHQMARVVVIVNSSGTDNKEQVTNVTFGDGHVGLTGSIETQATASANAIWTDISSSQSSTITLRDKTTAAEKTSNIYTFECILPPQSYATSCALVKISTKYVLNSTTYNRTYTHNDSYALNSGNQYTYSISISESGKIIVSTVQVTPWTTSPVTGNGNYPSNSYPSANLTE